MGHAEHKAHARKSVRCAILTVSDTRDLESDVSGALIRKLLEEHGHRVEGRDVVPDDPTRIRDWISAKLTSGGAEVLLVNGGTGLAPRDTTAEAVRGLLEKEIEGYGELFRALSYEEIGSAAMLSRAVGGVVKGKAIFVMPGSSAAVRLAMEKLVLPELGHVVGELSRPPSRPEG